MCCLQDLLPYFRFRPFYLDKSSPNKKDHECQLCPLGGYCTGDISWAEVRPKYGWWRLHAITVNNTNHPPNCLNQINTNASLESCVIPALQDTTSRGPSCLDWCGKIPQSLLEPIDDYPWLICNDDREETGYWLDCN